MPLGLVVARLNGLHMCGGRSDVVGVQACLAGVSRFDTINRRRHRLDPVPDPAVA